MRELSRVLMPALPANVAFHDREGTNEPGRAFVNITTRGCGCGCRYCYIVDPGGPQVLISERQACESLEFLLAHPLFELGKHGTVLSLCPGTEPYRTKQSIHLIATILGQVLPLGNPVQISTKEAIPPEMLDLIGRLSSWKHQVVNFTSITTVSRASLIEPHAASVALRAGNFESCREAGLFSCIYIKPFTSLTYRDLPLFLELVAQSRPNAACVGMKYTSVPDEGRPYRHPIHANLRSGGIDALCRQFVEALESGTGGISVFHTSVCVTAVTRDRFPLPRIWREYPALCVSCRDCEGEDGGSPEAREVGGAR